MRLSILGATGSIGKNTLDVVRRHSSRYEVFALTANKNVELLYEQCREFEPDIAVMRDADAAADLEGRLAGSRTRVLSGAAALEQVASADECDAVMAAIVGGAGLAASFAAATAGKRVLLANKESLVMSGGLFMKAIRDSSATLLPIDSEHNAIYQCLANGADDHAMGVDKILLTASGGPFRNTPLDQLLDVTPQQACAHPNWSMGRKISVDSATMMNKGLELIEACWLFDLRPQDIEIVVHPQSIVHSMVQYIDGSVIAQMGNPDMRTPIAHGLAWPERIDSGVDTLDVVASARLDFEAADQERFPCLRLAREAAGASQGHSIALNAANEVAVQGFLDELIRFTDIPLIIETVLEQTCSGEAPTIEQVVALDKSARVVATETMARFL
jgi:1-deoxy-D-xylulose-5-phosphate reductoisomerase